MKLTPVTLAAAIVIIGSAGFLAGRISNSGSETAGASTDSAVETRATRPSSRPGSASGDRETERARTAREGMRDSESRKARLEEIVRGENALDRNRALLAYIDQLGPGEFEDAIEHFRSLGLTESRMGEYSLLLTAWAKADPTGALTYAQESTNGNFARNTILTSWATLDPDAAIRWADSNHEGDGPNPYMAGVIRGIAETDPARATDLLTSMPRSGERGEALEAMMAHILRQGPDAARSWITALNDDSLRDGAMMRMARGMATTDPSGTVDLLVSNPGDAAQRRLDDVYNQWSGQDRQAALSSMATLPQGELRTNALRGIASNIASSNPQEAVALLDRYPADVTDRVVEQVVWSSFGSDPSIAASQISRMTNEGQRDRMYRRTLDAWMRRDAAAAQTWIQSNPLPESVQRHLSRRQ